MGGTVLAGLLVHHVTRHKHGNEVTGGEAALVRLKEKQGREMWVYAAVFKLEKLSTSLGDFIFFVESYVT